MASISWTVFAALLILGASRRFSADLSGGDVGFQIQRLQAINLLDRSMLYRDVYAIVQLTTSNGRKKKFKFETPQQYYTSSPIYDEKIDKNNPDWHIKDQICEKFTFGDKLKTDFYQAHNINGGDVGDIELVLKRENFDDSGVWHAVGTSAAWVHGSGSHPVYSPATIKVNLKAFSLDPPSQLNYQGSNGNLYNGMGMKKVTEQLKTDRGVDMPVEREELVLIKHKLGFDKGKQITMTPDFGEEGPPEFYDFYLAGGDLPDGLSFDGKTGVISGACTNTDPAGTGNGKLHRITVCTHLSSGPKYCKHFEFRPKCLEPLEKPKEASDSKEALPGGQLTID